MNIAGALACPQGDGSAVISAAIAGKWREQAVRLVSNRLCEIGEHALAAQLVSERDVAESWHPGIGLAHEALATGRPQLAALQFCISEARKGKRDRLACAVGTGGGLLVDGWNVDVRGDTVVSFDGNYVGIESELEARFSEFQANRLVPVASRSHRPSTPQTHVLRYAVASNSIATVGQFPCRPM